MVLSTERWLQVRMVVALLLVATFPVLFLYALLWVFGEVVPWLLATLLGDGTGAATPGSVGVSLRVLVGGAVAMLALQYLAGDRLALRSSGARRVDDGEYPELRGTLDRLAQQAGVPSPGLAVMDTEMPNAFTTGRSPSNATVVVSTGLVETLDDDELEAVLAHELAHVKNRDVAVMSLAYLLPSVTVVVATTAYTVLGGMWNAVGNHHVSHSDDDGLAVIVAVIVVFVVTSVLTMTISAVFWAASFLVYRLLSRYREYAADRGAARITGDPAALASALETVKTDIQDLPDRDLRRYDGGIEALYVAPLDTEMFTDGEDALISRDLFPATHPPTDERVEYLREIQRAV